MDGRGRHSCCAWFPARCSFISFLVWAGFIISTVYLCTSLIPHLIKSLLLRMELIFGSHLYPFAKYTCCLLGLWYWYIFFKQFDLQALSAWFNPTVRQPDDLSYCYESLELRDDRTLKCMWLVQFHSIASTILTNTIYW